MFFWSDVRRSIPAFTQTPKLLLRCRRPIRLWSGKAVFAKECQRQPSISVGGGRTVSGTVVVSAFPLRPSHLNKYGLSFVRSFYRRTRPYVRAGAYFRTSGDGIGDHRTRESTDEGSWRRQGPPVRKANHQRSTFAVPGRHQHPGI